MADLNRSNATVLPISDFQKIDEHGDIFRQMFKYSVIPTIIHDMQMNIVNVNDSALEQFGYTKDEILQKSIYDLHPPDELDHSNEVLNEMQEKEKLSVETAFVRKDGSKFWAEATPCKYLVGSEPYIHVFIQDITEKKLAENKLKNFNKELQIKNKELEQFAYIAAHDLKSPLATIFGMADLVNLEVHSLDIDSQRKEVLVDLMQRVQKNIKHMQELISDILVYSTVGNKRAASEAINLNQVVNDILKNYKDLLRSSQIEVHIDTLPEIKSSFSMMKQLFHNLIDNSVKFRKKNTTLKINITCRPSDQGWQLTYEDNGIGISPQARGKVFKLFQRAKEVQKYPGTGLGLSICEKVASLHNGSISIDESYPHDAGARFIIYLEDLN